MQNAIKRAMSRYARFSGRASRPEFWWWALFATLILAISQIIDARVLTPLLGLVAPAEESSQPLSVIMSLLLLLPSLGVAVRRLHDTNREGWWVFILLVPVLGSLVIAYFCIQPSDDGRNGYGDPDPVP